MRKDLPEQAPVMSFFSRPIPNSHQVIDTVNCLKSNIDVYSAYNNEKTRLNFGIFYSVIKNRWSNIATQWNSDKVFNIVGHYAAAKQNFITVNATEIDYEDISKSSNASSDLSNSTSSDPQSSIVNRFYDSLNTQQSPPTTNTYNINSDQITPENTTTSPSLENSNSSSLPQQIVSSPIVPNTTSASSIALTPNTTSQPSNLIYGQYPQYYQPTNSTNSPNQNNPTLLPYPQLPYFNPMHPMHHQYLPNLQQNSPKNTSNDPNLSQSKTQGLTLPHTTVSLDTSMFACGQAYVAMSRATSWQDLDITYFDLVSIKTDKRVIKEYERLLEENRTKLQNYLIDI